MLIKILTLFKNFLFLFILFLIPSSLFALQNGLDIVPMPREIKRLPGKFIIYENFGIKIFGQKSERVVNAKKRFFSRLTRRTGIFFSLYLKKSPLNLYYKKL